MVRLFQSTLDIFWMEEKMKTKINKENGNSRMSGYFLN